MTPTRDEIIDAVREYGAMKYNEACSDSAFDKVHSKQLGKSASEQLTEIEAMLRALRDQREETIAKLADPAAVVANMMRGHIAKPDFRAFLSIYGEVFNDLEAANIANIELRDQREADAMDAGRYRVLRASDWFSSPICCVRNPKNAVMPGSDCPSHYRLDEAVDKVIAAMSAQGEGLWIT